MDNNKKNNQPVIIAVIGLVGVMFTAVMANFTSLFPKKTQPAVTIPTTSSGTTKSGNPETTKTIMTKADSLKAVNDARNKHRSL
ncbi:MAG: hypothetical protein J7539_13925 [Niabella sp.]|nr:hypothetical protein [Niabella sp.]